MDQQRAGPQLEGLCFSSSGPLFFHRAHILVFFSQVYTAAVNIMKKYSTNMKIYFGLLYILLTMFDLIIFFLKFHDKHN